MADLTITAASVVKTSTTEISEGIAGVTITAGQALYIDTGDNNELKLADNDASALTKACVGIALHAALDGQPIKYATKGALTVGAILTAGVFYYLSNTAGGICPVADVGAGETVVLLGYASTTSALVIGIVNTGVAL